MIQKLSKDIMKIGFISDIHGNFKAFEAVLDKMASKSVDKIICLGDVATLGPQPRQVLKKLRVLEIDCVKGNHDEALFDLENLENYRIPEVLKPTMTWCRDQLNGEEMDFISKFKKSIDINIDGYNTIIACHGTAKSNTVGILPETSDEDVSDIFDSNDTILQVGGHTHIQMDRVINKSRIVSTGSVGCPFLSTPKFGEEPNLNLKAQFAIVELENEKISVKLESVPYDLEGYKRIILESELPAKDWWLKQF